MNYSDFIAGLILIVFGILVVKFPMLIAGYNTMPKEKRDKVDIDGLSRMIRRWFIGLGLCLIISAALLSKFAPYDVKEMFNLIIVLIGVMIIMLKAKKYDP